MGIAISLQASMVSSAGGTPTRQKGVCEPIAGCVRCPEVSSACPDAIIYHFKISAGVFFTPPEYLCETIVVK